jgi:hypothetical protein
MGHEKFHFGSHISTFFLFCFVLMKHFLILKQYCLEHHLTFKYIVSKVLARDNSSMEHKSEVVILIFLLKFRAVSQNCIWDS